MIRIFFVQFYQFRIKFFFKGVQGSKQACPDRPDRANSSVHPQNRPEQILFKPNGVFLEPPRLEPGQMRYLQMRYLQMRNQIGK